MHQPTTEAPASAIITSRSLEPPETPIAPMVRPSATSGIPPPNTTRVVIGGRLLPVTALDLRLTGVLLFRNGVAIESGAGAAALGNPVRCLAWLANRLGALGTGLRRDDVVLPEALHRMVPVRPGDVFRARFAHLGPVTVRFSAEGRAA